MPSVRRAGDPHFYDQPSTQRALRVMLGAMFICSLAIAVFTFALGWRLTPRFSLAAAASCLLALVIGRSGRIRKVILLPLLTIAYVVLHLAANNRGIHSGGLVIIPVLIMVGSRVLDRWPLIAFAAFVNVGVFAMLAFQHLVKRAEPFPISELGDLFVFVAT